MPHKILMLPLDERPCNYWYPRYVAPIGGVELIMPPAEILPRFREPGDPGKLRQWLMDNIDGVDAAVISVDLLGYGGLIPSRIGHESVQDVLDRLDVLREARQRKPDLVINGFNIIMRTSNSTVNTEEPEYWTPWGTTIFRISQLIDRVDRLGKEEDERELAELKAKLPEDILKDYLERRARNHAVNRAVIAMADEGVFDFVFLSQDDASEFGLPAREQRTLRADIRDKNIGDKVVVYPGADEVGLIMLARAACSLEGYSPRFFPRWASTGAENIVALFEDRPLGQTVRGEVYCCGGVTVDSPRDADVMLFLNTPGEAQDYPNRAATAKTVETAARNLPDFLAALRYYAGQTQVALADVAYCNGGDPALVPLVPKFIDYPQLAAYGGWNTAANTIGTVVAHAAMRTLGLHHVDGIDPIAREAAHQTFLFHRLLEDWGYQAVIRTEIEHELVTTSDWNPYKLGEHTAAVCADAQRRIEQLAGKVFDEWFCDRGASPDPTIRPESWSLESVSLPWDRTFEAGIELSVGVHAVAGEDAKD